MPEALAVAAGLAMLEIVSTENFYETLSKKTKLLMEGLEERASAADIAFTTNHAGGMFGCFFNKNSKVKTFKEVMESNNESFQVYFHEMLNNGYTWPPQCMRLDLSHGSYRRRNRKNLGRSKSRF